MFLRLSKALIIATAFALALVACSRIDLAYRNLDRLVPWSLDDYLAMNRDQRSLLDERLKQHLAWHCTTQLPGYLDWLDRIRSMVAEGQVTDQALQQRMNEARQAIGRVAEAITPSATELLRGMSDAQVAQMGDAFREDISERQKKYVDTPCQNKSPAVPSAWKNAWHPGSANSPPHNASVCKPGHRRWATRTASGSPTVRTGNNS